MNDDQRPCVSAARSDATRLFLYPQRNIRQDMTTCWISISHRQEDHADIKTTAAIDCHFLCYYTKSSGQRPDFRDADWLPESRYRLDVPVIRNSKMRLRSLAYVFELFAVLSLAHAERGEESRLIGFRKASAEEREMYHEWLENDCTD
ncbi:BrnT family toxin [Acidithiobacillus ferridurans]|uniref:hypothetical protein n=1 Tax=Acidithiobacillus ferridurans TaxID=1232575 RepID=UPI001C07B6B0|nr:hypothetical protein [Acidithiobacillus ferridurans]